MMAKCMVLVLTIVTQIVISATLQPVDHLLPPPQQNRIRIPRIRQSAAEPPGFMQRIAKWFGIGNNPNDQQVDASYQYQQYKDSPHPYQYHRPKALCNLCNKVPWIPMFPGHMQYPVVNAHYNQPPAPQIQYHQYETYNNIPGTQYAPAFHFQPPLVQRAIKFNFPTFNGLAHSGPGPGAPETVYKTENFIPPQLTAPIPIPNLSITPIPPLYNAVRFNPQPSRINTEHNEHGEASEFKTTAPSQSKPQLTSTLTGSGKDSSFEIVQSVPVTDFISSIEYPANVVQSHVIDITASEKPTEPTESFPKLVELGSYEPTNPATSSDHTPEPIVVHNHNYEPDNYPEASSHNFTYKREQYENNNNLISSTLEPFRSTEGISLQTEIPFENILNVNAEIGSIKHTIQLPAAPRNPEPGPKRDRQTPKQLLDSPILYVQGSSPRPFTRDPSDLRVRSSTYNHNYWQPGPTPTPWVFAPSPTSTYSSVDASGQFAGMSPPPQFQPPVIPYSKPSEKTPKHFHQIIIPYTTKNKPRPFMTRDEQHFGLNDDRRYVNWSSSQEVELHEQQESKLVTATESPSKKTTKYLTKILASNIRDLLRREHDNSSRLKNAFDFTKLQKNIDDWTQQEFTSLTHKASTVSLRGRSKHIPTEYLTTTPSLFQTTSTSENVESLNTTNRIDSLLNENEIKKYDLLNKLIDDNHISYSENIPQTTGSPATSTSPEAPVSPFYVRSVVPTPTSEPWEKLKVSISPLTKEKVYVVTPQSIVQHKGSEDSIGSFKSPRFLIRPTPGIGGRQSSNTASSVASGYTPELFGLMGLSAYIPAAPVETSDGHSKVITVITPSPKLTENVTESAQAKNVNGKQTTIKSS